MAINRYYTPAQSQPFDPYIVDTATMYGNLRQAGYDNLLAKQQLDVNTQNKIDKTLDSLKAFAPENTEVFIPLNNGGSKTEQSKLPAFYNQMTSGIYKGASDIAAKYNNNYTSPEAQKEISDFLNQTKSILPKLQELKNSDKALGEQNKIGEEHLKSTPLDALQGTLGEHVKTVRDKWVNPNDFNFHTSLSAPTKGVNMSEAINKYIGDNLIQSYGDEAYKKLGVVVGADGIPTFDISKTSTETRKRLASELDKLADNFTKTNKNHIHNVALEGMQNKELGEGFKDQKDAEKTYFDAFSNKELEWKNRFREHEINDKKTKTDLTSKFVPTDYAKDGGMGMYKDLGGLTPVEFFATDNKNKPVLLPQDSKGNLYAIHPRKLITGSSLFNDEKSFSTPNEYFNYLTSQGAIVTDDFKKQALLSFSGENDASILSNILNDKGTFAKTVELPQLYKQDGKPFINTSLTSPKVMEGDKLDFNNPIAIKKSIDSNPILKNILVNQGVDLSNINKQVVEQAVKNDQEAIEKYAKVALNGYSGRQFNSPKINEQLNDNLQYTTVRIGKVESLNEIPKDIRNKLKDAISSDYSIDGGSFQRAIGDGYIVDINTNGSNIGSGQTKTSTGIVRTAIIREKLNGPIIAKIPFVQDLYATDINDKPSLQAVAKINELITSGQDIYGEYNGGIDLGNGYKAQLNKVYNSNTRSYDIDGEIFLPNGRTIPFKDFMEKVSLEGENLIKSSISRLGNTESPVEKKESINDFD